eukprot:scaffold201257_cov37-Prasinocladus_malaysianus.AAC.2
MAALYTVALRVRVETGRRDVLEEEERRIRRKRSREFGDPYGTRPGGAGSANTPSNWQRHADRPEPSHSLPSDSAKLN